MSHLAPLEVFYQSYVAALNARNWTEIQTNHVRPTVTHNNIPMTPVQYTTMIEESLKPYGDDVVFFPEILVVDTAKGLIAAKLTIENPQSTARVKEHVFYQCVEEKIHEVWSMVEEIKKP